MFDRGGGLIYDDVLDLTWLQDANLVFSNAPDECFPEPPGEGGGEICVPPSESAGLMTWDEARAWASDLAYHDTVRDVIWNDWRLPSMSPIDGSAFDIILFTNNASSDAGYAPTTTDGSDGGWRDGSGIPVSEMGHLYYVSLANIGRCPPDDASPSACPGEAPPDFGLVETGPFVNLSKSDIFNSYWTGTPTGTDKAGYLNFLAGFQRQADTDASGDPDELYAWAVRDGDVAQSVPEPTGAWLFGSVLIALARVRPRRG